MVSPVTVSFTKVTSVADRPQVRDLLPRRPQLYDERLDALPLLHRVCIIHEVSHKRFIGLIDDRSLTSGSLPGRMLELIGMLGGAGGVGKRIDFARANEVNVGGELGARDAALFGEILGLAGVGEAVEVKESGARGGGGAEGLGGEAWECARAWQSGRADHFGNHVDVDVVNGHERKTYR